MFANRPLVFTDLDDTLFQTARKMPADAVRHTATFDGSGEPNGYMSNIQKSFVTWLLANADVVPVTARSVEVCGRVDLPFSCGAICSHGGVILDANGQVDQDWHQRMTARLAPHQERLRELSWRTLEIGKKMGFSLRGWVVEEIGHAFYVVTKHNEKTDFVLQAVEAEVRRLGLLDGLYVHRNGNNLAFLPKELNKRWAVLEWIRRDRERHGERPILGFGDSLSDLAFMSECNWWATPNRGQIAAQITAEQLKELG
jgi:hypothetical protein